MKTFKGIQTDYEGLWWHPESNYFSSAAIDLSILKEFKGPVRVYVRKNRTHSDGEDKRPNYLFWLRDANAKAHPIGLRKDDGDDDDQKERLYTEEEVYACIRGACMDGAAGYDPGDLLIQDYIC